MPTFLKNMKITFISLVKKGANNRKLIMKTGDEAPVWQVSAEIRKAEADGSRVFSIVYPAGEYDSQGEWSNAEEIQKAAYEFMRNLRLLNIDKGHSYEKEGAFVAESWIIRKGDPLFPSDPEGSWAVAIVIEDPELKEAVKKGEIEAVSMGGTGDKAVGLEIEKAWETTENSFRHRLKDPGQFQEGSLKTISLTAGIKMVIGKLKGQTTTTGQSLIFDKKTFPSIDAAKKWVSDHKDRFKKSFSDEDVLILSTSGVTLEKFEEISSRESLFARIGTFIKGLFESEKFNQGGDDMNKEETQAMIDEAIKKAIDPLKDTIEKSKGLTKEEIAGVVTECLKPVVERVEKVEKATPGSKQGTSDGDPSAHERQITIGKEIAKMVNEKMAH